MDEIVALEDRLRAAMLAGDAEALDAMLADDCVFTDQKGQRMTKAQDLAAHRSGLLRVAAIDLVGARAVRCWGDAAVVCVTNDLAGRYDGQAFAGRFAYTRVWRREAAAWRVVAAHASAVTPA